MTREQVLVDKDKLERLIDRQIPKWVDIIKINTYDWPEYEYYCPRCNGFLNCYLSDPYKYCPNCGQAIRWSIERVVEVQDNGKSYND